jgi:hypothetical protein
MNFRRGMPGPFNFPIVPGKMVEIVKKGKESLCLLKEIQSAAENLCAATPPISLRRMNPRFLVDVSDSCVLSVFGS